MDRPPFDPSDARQLKQLFLGAFTVMNIAEALLSFDRERDGGEVAQVMQRRKCRVAGIRVGGRTAGFVDVEKLGPGPVGEAMRPFDPSAVLLREASLADAVAVVDRHGQAFVSILGEVGAVVGRPDLQKPPMRMWLFGMVTILEMNITRAVRVLYPQDGWKPKVPGGRQAKAAALKTERERRGQPCDLLDCLQFSDKAYILTKDPELRRRLRFQSAREGERAVKAIESLRNHLAHSQDILSHDWATIVQLTSGLDDLLEAKGLTTLLDQELE